MNTKNVVMTTILLTLGLAISVQAQAPVPGEPGLLVWVKADDGVQNSGNTGPCVVGSPTGDWLDKSGNGNNANWIEGTMTLETANFGDPAADHNVVRFYGDGIYQLLGPDPNALLKDVLSVFVVIQTGMPEGSGDYYRNTYFSTTLVIDPDHTGVSCDLFSGGRLQCYTGGVGCVNEDFVAANDAPGLGDPGAGYHIICTRIDMPHMLKSIALNGETMGESLTTACLAYLPGTKAWLGVRAGLWSHVDTSLAEAIIYNDARLETKARIESYLSQKYGIPLVAKVCGDHGIHAADLNENCEVNLEDFAIMATTWLQCTDPAVPGCGFAEL